MTQSDIINANFNYLKNNSLNKQQISNCITEIPQRIKYTLNDGTLTILAGSVVIVPYGTEDLSATYPIGSEFLNPNFKVYDRQFVDGKFFVWAELQNDIIRSYASTSTIVRYSFLNMDKNTYDAYEIGRSGTSPVNNAIVYRTDLNMCIRSSTGTQDNICCLPFMKVKGDGSFVEGSVEQVFNGIGYIGLTRWVDKGVKGLISDGFNNDGSLKNIEYTTNRIITQSYTGSSTAVRDNTWFLIIPTQEIQLEADYYQNVYISTVENFGDMPQISSGYRLCYVKNDNKMYYADSSTSYKYVRFKGLAVSNEHIDNGVITSFNPKTTFHAIDYNDNNLPQVDGQWVAKQVILANAISCSSTDVTYDLSSYLPNDNENYEVMFIGYVQTTATSGKFADLTIKSSIISNVYMGLARTRTASTVDSQGSAIVPIGVDRSITIQGNSSGNLGGTHSLTAIGYRRLGTNV